MVESVYFRGAERMPEEDEKDIHYKARMRLDGKGPEDIKTILHQISDIRKFEINLYWDRAKYFWTLIGAAFVGYYVSFPNKADLSSKPSAWFLGMTIAGLGLIFSDAWFLANKGSKYWQENWENHLVFFRGICYRPFI
jgi:hypothetical protein